MANWNRTWFDAAIYVILVTLLVNGCAGGQYPGAQSLQRDVTTEYLLSTAGFQRWDVNDETPKRQALLNNLPQRTIVTYKRNGEVYHAYADDNTLYIGDETAYQKYVSLAGGRKLCQRVTGTNQVEFWSCMQEYRERGK